MTAGLPLMQTKKQGKKVSMSTSRKTEILSSVLVEDLKVYDTVKMVRRIPGNLFDYSELIPYNIK